MAVDKASVDAILGTYRNMLKEVTDKKASGGDFEKMKSVLAEMESLALESDDMIEFTTKLTTKNLFVDFSNAYSNVLISAGKQEYEGDQGDEKLLQQTLSAYENAVTQLEGKKHSEKLIAPIKEVIELGKSGISYPGFLRICEEKGLNKALEGSVVVRDAILEEIDFAVKDYLPLNEKMLREILKMFDELSSKAEFGIPDSAEFGLKRIHIEWKYVPEINKWDMIIRHWEKMLESVYDWVDSYGKFATGDTRWVDLRGIKYTKQNIRRTNDCNPGIFKQQERIFYESFGLKWEDIFEHDTFKNEMKAGRIPYSDENLSIIRDAYPLCKPFSKPSEDLIQRAEKEYNLRFPNGA